MCVDAEIGVDNVDMTDGCNHEANVMWPTFLGGEYVQAHCTHQTASLAGLAAAIE